MALVIVYDGLLSGICIDVDAGTVMIAWHGSYDCRYYTCNVLHKRSGSIGILECEY